MLHYKISQKAKTTSYVADLSEVPDTRLHRLYFHLICYARFDINEIKTKYFILHKNTFLFYLSWQTRRKLAYVIAEAGIGLAFLIQFNPQSGLNLIQSANWVCIAKI